MFGRVLALVLVASAAMTALPARGAEAPAASEQRFTPDQARADFTALYRGLQEAQYDIYAKTPKAELDKAFAADLAALDHPMSRFEIETRFERFVARIRVAHARVDFPEVYERYRAGGGAAFPLSIRVDGGHVFVTQNGSGVEAISPGDELVALDGAPIAGWIARTSRDVSADTPYLANSLLEFEFPELLWLELGPVPGFDVVVRKSDGRRLALRLAARTRDEVRAAVAAQPAAFRLDGARREARVLPGGVGYLKPGPFYDPTPGADEWDPTAFKAFIDASFRSFLDAKVTSLLIDLRENPGGDDSFSDPMVAWFADRPFRFFSHFKIRVSRQTIASNQARIEASKGAADGASSQLAALYAKAPIGGVVEFDMPYAQPRPAPRFTGKVYLLVNRHSYSNTVNVAALVQDYGFGKILGEETSDMATTYGAMETFVLPNTGIVVGYPKAHIIRVNGDPNPRGVVPDIVIASPVIPGQDDVVLDRALEIVRRGGR